jgi:carbamoyltransferase
MYVVGISSFYHDSSVSLFKNGTLVFACEEEKFTGIKHDSSFPKNTINYITKKYKLTKENVNAVCYYEDPKLKKKRVIEYSKKTFFNRPIFSIKNYLEFLKNNKILKRELNKISNNIFYSTHHHSHLYYSAFSSPFNESAVISIDGVGEYDTTTISYYQKDKLVVEEVSQYPHSLGLFYSAMTSFMGFKPNEGEYKLMGLAPYGKKTDMVDSVSKLIKFEDGKIINDLNYFEWYKSDKVMFNYNLSELLGVLPRTPNEEITQKHKNLAFAVQYVYENVFFELLRHVQNKYKTTNMCLGGGCAYNGSANGKIYYRTSFRNVWIPPAPSDAGSCVGAVINYYVTNGKIPTIPQTPFLGPSFQINTQFKTNLTRRNFIYLTDDNLYRLVAKEIQKGKVVGWFRDEIEFGARALGNRSILADPTDPNMKDRINRMVKRREGFRPFAPMVTKERQHEFFETNDDIPYMNQVVRVKDEYRNKLVSVTHVDGTARVQTVQKDKSIYKLLREYESITGYPILLNTSFNIKDKTMVLTPQQALSTFDEVDIDVLVLQNFIIFKNRKK